MAIDREMQTSQAETGLLQAQFTALMGVSVRTLPEREHGPSPIDVKPARIHS